MFCTKSSNKSTNFSKTTLRGYEKKLKSLP
jgi:hypothetical protein